MENYLVLKVRFPLSKARTVTSECEYSAGPPGLWSERLFVLYSALLATRSLCGYLVLLFVSFAQYVKILDYPDGSFFQFGE